MNESEKRLENIALLLKETYTQIEEISRLYKESIDLHSFSPTLNIRIKNFLENLKSSLDYFARYIYEEFCIPNINARIYFPITKIDNDKNTFFSQMKKWFPGLQENRLDILEILWLWQPVNNEIWLLNLRDLCNFYKHEDFAPQIRDDIAIGIAHSNSGIKYEWTNNCVEISGGKLKLSGGGALNISKSQLDLYRHPLDIQFKGWKVKDLPKKELLNINNWNEIDINNIDFFLAGNFYFPEISENKNAYSLLYTFYTNTKNMINAIFKKINQK